MEYTQIRFDNLEGGVARLTLDRPHAMNAYTTEMCVEIVSVVRRFMADDDLRVLILTGAGRAFCSGGDIKGGDPNSAETHGRQLGHARDMRDSMHLVARELWRLDKPVIAMINGPAVAGGLTLALLCDIRIASDRARLGDTSGRAGLLPDEGGAWLFPRFMGLDRALRMSLLAEVYEAAVAKELGLVTEVVPDAELGARTLEIARHLAAMAPIAVRLAKRLMVRGLESTFDLALDDAAIAVMVANETEDAKEGIRAFAERRPPVFRGR